MGLGWTALEWKATATSNMLTGEEKVKSESAKFAQIKFLADVRVIDVPGLTSLDTMITTEEGEKISMRNILMTMRTQTDYDTCIFTQVDTNYFGKVQASLHANEYDEGCFKAQYLYTILRKQFGRGVSKAFDYETITASQNYEFDEERNTIVNNSIQDFDASLIKCFKQSPAVRARIIKNGGSEADWEVYEMEEENQEEVSDDIKDFVFELPSTFPLVLPEKSGPQYDTMSLSTKGTGATGATKRAQERQQDSDSSMDSEEDEFDSDDEDENEDFRVYDTDDAANSSNLKSKEKGINANESNEAKDLEEEEGVQSNDEDNNFNETSRIENADKQSGNGVKDKEDGFEDNEDDNPIEVDRNSRTGEDVENKTGEMKVEDRKII